MSAALIFAGCAASGGKTVVMNTYYVSTGGKDSNPGTEKKPFATIQKARDTIRELKASGELPPGEITVVIKAGEYYLPDGVAFTSEDSGTTENPITYRASGDGDVILTGGITLKKKNFKAVSGDITARLPQEAADKIVVCDLKKLGIMSDDWGKIYSFGTYTTASKYDGDTTGPLPCELFFNGERMTLARYPNKGSFLRILSVSDEGDTGSAEGWSALKNPRGGTFTYRKAEEEHIESWATYDDVWIFGYFRYDWAEMTTPVAQVNKDENTLTTAYASNYGFTRTARYYFFNVLEELDSPGEWYLDRENGLLYFYPPNDLDGGEISLSLSTSNLITVTNADYLTFEGLTLKDTRGSGIAVTGDNCAVKNCRITDIAENALTMTGYHNLAERNEIFHIGSAGISMSGGDRQTLTPSDSVASNNLVHDWSEVNATYRSAIGIGGVGITVSHNEMYSAPHLAILYSGNNHIIEYNIIHNVCSETIDGGAIYSGRDWTQRGTVIRYNYLYDINAEIGNPVALYFDDALSGQTAYGNIFYNIKGIGILAGGGRDITLENNVFISVGTPISYDDRARDGFVNNGWFAPHVVPENGTLWENLKAVPYTGEAWAAAYPNLAKITTDRADYNNIDFPCNPSYGVILNNVLYKSGKDLGNLADSVCTYGTIGQNAFFPENDPGFIDAANQNFAFSDNAAVFSELPDFENIPFDRIGMEK